MKQKTFSLEDNWNIFIQRLAQEDEVELELTPEEQAQQEAELDPDIQDVLEFIRYWGRKRFILRLWYMDRFGNRTERRIEPYEIRYPYLWGYGLEPGTSINKKHPRGLGIRKFRIDRIENIDRAKGRFFARWEIKL